MTTWNNTLIKLVYVQNGHDDLYFVFFFDTVPRLLEELESDTFTGFHIGDPVNLGHHKLEVFDTQIEYMENEKGEQTEEIDWIVYYVKSRKRRAYNSTPPLQNSKH